MACVAPLRKSRRKWRIPSSAVRRYGPPSAEVKVNVSPVCVCSRRRDLGASAARTRRGTASIGAASTAQTRATAWRLPALGGPLSLTALLFDAMDFIGVRSKQWDCNRIAQRRRQTVSETLANLAATMGVPHG